MTHPQSNPKLQGVRGDQIPREEGSFAWFLHGLVPWGRGHDLALNQLFRGVREHGLVPQEEGDMAQPQLSQVGGKGACPSPEEEREHRLAPTWPGGGRGCSLDP